MIEANSKKSLFVKFAKILIKSIKWFLILSVGLTLFYRFVPVAITPLMVWRSVASVFVGEKFVGIEKDWVAIEDISKSMQQSVIKAEDYKFYQHYGFDFEAIEKAMEYNRTHKKKKGASTISQQTAKNVFLWPSRSWIRKGLEAYFTILIELFWPKQRILEVYLNVIELGHGVYGVEAAAQKFFKRPAKKLNSSQAALMAAVLPNPIRFRIDKPSRYITKRQRKIMGRRAPPLEVLAQNEQKVLEKVVDEKALDNDDKNKSNEEKSKEFFSLKFDSDDEVDSSDKNTKEKGAEAPSPENQSDSNND
jgi:monofunctional biosynthetic peptidoglycan transglycosylase